MKNKIQNKIDELEKEIERLKPVGNYLEDCSKEFSKMNKLSLKQLKEIYTESTNMSYVGFLMGEIQAYKEAQNLMDEMLTQTNLRNHSREQQMKKSFDETEKSILNEIDDFDLNELKDHDGTIDDDILKDEIKEIIQKHYSVRVKGRAPDASQSTSNKRDTGNPDTLLDDFCEELKGELEDIDEYDVPTLIEEIDKIKQKHLGGENE